MKLALKNQEIYELFKIKIEEFPKYTTQIMNLANQNSQGTRPKVVGQLSELIQHFEGESFEDWVSWYEKKYPTAISNAVNRISKMVENLRQAIHLINDEMIEKWAKDLVYNKTFFGLKIQNIILKKLEEDLKAKTRLANPEEESKNIDGFIDKTPVQIKPITHKQKKHYLKKLILISFIMIKKRIGLILRFQINSIKLKNKLLFFKNLGNPLI